MGKERDKVSTSSVTAADTKDLGEMDDTLVLVSVHGKMDAAIKGT